MSKQIMWQFGPISHFLGVLTEYFDLFIISATLPILTKVFLPAQMPQLISAFYVVGTFAVAYLTRPIGAAIFGHYSDRIGRRLLMIFSMGGMAIATALVSILPTYDQAGFVGLISLVIIRMFVGMFYGGERSAGVSYSQEFTPAKWRGLVSGLSQVGTGIGGFSAGGITAVFLAFYGNDAMIAYAWRYVFLVGIIPFIVVAFIRLYTVESPMWQTAKASGKLEKTPLASLLKGDTRFRFLQATLTTIGFLIMGATINSYLVPMLISPPSRLSMAQELMAYNAFVIISPVVGLAIGQMSQYIGRRRMLMIIAITTIMTILPTTYGLVMFGSSLSMVPVLLIAVWLGSIETFPYGCIDVYLAERFGTSHRASGAGMSYALGNLFGGVVVILVAPILHGLLAVVETTNIWLTTSALCIVGSLIGLVGVYIGPETVWTKLEEVETKT